MRKFGVLDKVGYMFGDLGNDFFFTFVSNFLMLFYTDVMGIGGAIVGIIFLVARIWDAIMDVSWGRFIDSRPNTKHGKFKPWMMRMAFPLLVFGILMFTKIPGMSNRFYLIYAFATYILWGSLYSTVNIPYGSMASVITSDPIERASLSTFRSVGSAIAGVVISVVVPLIVFVDNRVDATRFSIIAIAFAILALICYSLCYFLTIERVNSTQPEGAKEPIYWKVTVAGLKRNKPLISLIGAALVLLISVMLTGSMNAYIFKDYFHSTFGLTLAGIISAGCTIILAPFVSTIIKKYGKKESAVVSVSIAAIMYLILGIIPIENVYLFLFIMFIGQMGVGLFNITVWAFVTDVIDYQEYLTDTREEGTIYSLYSFARKIGQAIAGGIGGAALTYLGYVEGAETQTVQVALNIKRFATLTPAVAYFIVVLILLFCYPLTKERLEKLNNDIKERRIQKLKNS